MLQEFTLYSQSLKTIKLTKVLINTVNAHSYNITQTDAQFHDALLNSTVLLPDGISVVFAVKWLTGQKLIKIAGADLLLYEMERLQNLGGKCFFLGSKESTLNKIEERVFREYPRVKVQSYSPPFKTEFSIEDNDAMLRVINAFRPDVLFIGMTAPKQEKWARKHFNQIDADHVCCIGAVFDFYAGTISRAPQWMIKLGLEWLFRLIKEPRRMWRRYLIGNVKFIVYIIQEKIYLLGNKYY